MRIGAVVLLLVSIFLIGACGDSTELRYDPFGPDRDCADFNSWKEAQAFYEAAGGPERDPHRLIGDRDGIACEGLR